MFSLGQCNSMMNGDTNKNEDIDSELSRRMRSIYARSPVATFGPKAHMVKVPKSQIMHVTDPSSQKLTWQEPPLSVLIIKKISDEQVLEHFKELATWLSQEKHMIVHVEASVLQDPGITEDELFSKIKNNLSSFTEGTYSQVLPFSSDTELGGDGTLLYASSLFQEGSVPPVMAFHLGSLGFLTPFDFANFRDSVTNVLEGEAPIMLRSRLKCSIATDEAGSSPEESDDSDSGVCILSRKENILPPQIICRRQVLNEVVIDRGPAPYLSHLDLYLDGRPITSVQGDGLIVSTPTGSTAYAAAAGGAMCHPNVPAILITPICPHSLSFRPIVIPAGVELKVMVPVDARSTAWASFDGRNRQEIQKGWSVKITTSIYPVASICRDDQISDWFDSLAECLHWNVRHRQGVRRQKTKDIAEK
ncbi:NAD kinase-like [Saccoglossus kowalevskii]